MLEDQYSIHWIMSNGSKGNGYPMDELLCKEWITYLKKEHKHIKHYAVKLL